MSFFLRILSMVLCAVLFVASCLLVAVPIFHLTERGYVRPVTADAMPDIFPVLVVWSTSEGWQARILPYPHLKEFRRAHAGDILRVPDGAEAEVRASLARWLATDVHAPARASFRVLGEKNRRQSLRVEYDLDPKQVNVGWYAASETSVAPERYLFYYFPGLLMAVLPLAFLIALVLWVVGYLALVRLTGGRAVELTHLEVEPPPPAEVSHGLDSLHRGSAQ